MGVPVAITLAPAGARTANGSGAAVDLGGRTSVALSLAVTAVSGGTPSLTVLVEHSADGELWSTLGTFSAVTSVGAASLRLPSAKRWVRARWSVTGSSPEFTFSVSGQALQPFATPEDFGRFGVAMAAVQGVSAADLDALLCARSETAEGYLAQRFVPPFEAWGDDLRQAVVHLAAWDALCRRGFNPDAPGDQVLRTRFDDAMRWLRDVGGGRATPAGLVDATPEVDEGNAWVFTRARRGW